MYGTKENGVIFRINDNKSLNIIKMIDGKRVGYSGIELPKDVVYFILNEFVKTDFV